MAMFSFWRSDDEVLDLTRVEQSDRLDRAVAGLTEPVVFAELAALARSAPEKTRSDRGFLALDPAGRPT